MASVWRLSSAPLVRRSSLLGQQVRFRSKLYKQPHYDEKILRACLEPVFKRPNVPTWEDCRNLEIKSEEVHPYEKILSEEFKEELRSRRFMALFQLNPVANKVYDRSRRTFLKHEFYLRRYNATVARITFEDTKYSTLIPFIVNETVFVFSQEPRVSDLLKVCKPMSEFLLLGGLVDGYLLSRDELVEYSNLPTKELLLSQVCNTLTAATAAPTASLDYHIGSLSMTLSQYEATKRCKPEE